jgi:hypothetical protein
MTQKKEKKWLSMGGVAEGQNKDKYRSMNTCT